MEFLSLNNQTSTALEAYVRTTTILTDIILDEIYTQFNKEDKDGRSCNYKKGLRAIAVKILHDMIWQDVFATSETISTDTINEKYNACEKIHCFIDTVSHSTKQNLFLIGDAHLCKSEDITYTIPIPTPPTVNNTLEYNVTLGVPPDPYLPFLYGRLDPQNGDVFNITVPLGSTGVCIAYDDTMDNLSSIYSPMSGDILSFFTKEVIAYTLPGGAVVDYKYYYRIFPSILTGDIVFTITI